jgi:hypothetical protein
MSCSAVKTPRFGSPTAKAPKPLTPVVCVLVAVRVPGAVVVQLPPEYRAAMNDEVAAPASTSPAMNVAVAPYVVKTTPVPVSVHVLLTLLVGLITDVAIWACSPAAVVATSVPAVETLAKVTEIGA